MANDVTLPALGKRETALERSGRVSRALHDAARKARLSVRGTARWQGGSSRRARGSNFALWSALVVFILPTLAAAVFFGLIATDQFQAEAQFAVRPRQIDQTDALGRISGISSAQAAQDALVVVDYIKSRAIVEKLDAELGLRHMFGFDELGWLDRHDPAEPIEVLVRYWRKKVYVTVEGSGIITLHVRAFRPDHALTIAKAVLAASEALVNGMSDRSRNDALTSARAEVTRAEQRLVELREEVRRVRDQERIIDPKTSLEGMNTLLAAARIDRIKLEDEYKVGLRSLSPTAPQMGVLKARLDSMNEQIRRIENQMTAAGPDGERSALSRSFTAYDKAILDQQSAEKLYTIIAASYEKARMDLSRQQIFVESFVDPVLPQEAEYPRRLWNTFLVGLAAFVAWFAVTYINASMRR